MLTAECYKQRMEKGLTFPVQLYDYAGRTISSRLYEDYGCNLEFGGDDQWSNMLAGTELIRRKLGKDSHAMTITLLNSEGKKMGKTVAERYGSIRRRHPHTIFISTGAMSPMPTL